MLACDLFVCVCVCVCHISCCLFLAYMCPVTAHHQVTIPAELTALMSAERQGEESHSTDTSKKVCRFHQQTPIPSYLIALVVGALDSRQVRVSSRNFYLGWKGVWYFHILCLLQTINICSF